MKNMYIISMFPEVHFLKLLMVKFWHSIRFTFFWVLCPFNTSILEGLEKDIYSWLERLLSTIALYLTCLKQIKWKLQNFWRWEQTSQKAVDYTQQLIRGIFTTTLQVNYNQILMLVFM